MYIERNGIKIDLLKDEIYQAYMEQLEDFFYNDAAMYIAEMSLDKELLGSAECEQFVKMMAGAAIKHNREVSNDRVESVEEVVDKYIIEHDYMFPFGSKTKDPYGKSPTNLFS